jgi:hypothetical protein
VKTLAKPLSNRLKLEAEKNSKFSNLCIEAGQQSHIIMSKMNVFASGYRVLKVKALPETEALTNGISIVSEAIVYFLSGTLIVLEYNRSERKNAMKLKLSAEKEEKFNKYLSETFLKIENKLDDYEKKHSKVEQELTNFQVTLTKYLFRTYYFTITNFYLFI